MKIIHGLPRAAKKGEWVGIDIELFGAEKERLHRPVGKFACLSISFQNGDTFQLTDEKDVGKAIRRVDKGTWILQNALFDLRHLRRWVEIPKRQIIDTMIVERDLFGGWYDSFALEDLVRRWLKKHLDKAPREEFSRRIEMTKTMQEYAAKDAYYALLVAQKQMEHAHKIGDPLHCYWEVDEPAIWAILDMAPIKVNVDGWIKLAGEIEVKANTIKQSLGFNPSSPPQTVEAVTKILGKKPRNSAAETLENLLEDAVRQEKTKAVNLLQAILEYRMYAKAASTYGKKWIEKHVEEDGLVYPSYWVVGAESGRMACSHPNMQQIPVRKFPQYRALFVPAAKSGRLLLADVSQQEPRICAYLSGDKELLEAVRTGDVYMPVAEAVFKTTKITKELRDRAKIIFLAATYGLSASGLAAREKMSKDEAEEFLATFFRKYRGVQNYMNMQQRVASMKGYVETPIGRRVWINPYSNKWVRNALNGPIQGGAADQTKLALAMIHSDAAAAGLPFCVNNVVHDEVCLDLPDLTIAKKYGKIVQECWETASERTTPGMPYKVRIKIGHNWRDK